ncbi:hypothetical protein Efla_000690 [Eimeria flavescens]
MKVQSRLKKVPWLRRILIGLSIACPILLLLYHPAVAAVTIWFICMVAASEHVTLRVAALNRLARRCLPEAEQRAAAAAAPAATAAAAAPAAAAEESSGVYAALTSAYKTSRLLMVCCSLLFLAEAIDLSPTPGFAFLSAAACVSFCVPAVSVFTYARHPEIPESGDALLYAWAAAGLDLYFLWHYAVPLALGSFILRRSGGLPLAASVIAMSAASDSGALFCGSAFGKRRIMQRLSPNKTLAGVLGSLLWALLVGVLLWHLSLHCPSLGLLRLPLSDYLTTSAITSIVGLGGDLVESAYKRCAGVKDSSGLFGPHGGVLDRSLFSRAVIIRFRK